MRQCVSERAKNMRGSKGEEEKTKSLISVGIESVTNAHAGGWTDAYTEEGEQGEEWGVEQPG